MLTLSNLIKSPGKFKILIVDASPAVRHSLRNILKNLGLNNFREAGEATEALDRLKVETYDLCLCDWNVLEGSGISMLVGLRNDPALEKLTVLVLAPRDIDAQVDGVLVKPFSPEALEEKLVEIIFKKLPPSPVDERVFKAGGHIAQGDFTRAHSELDKAAKLEPRNPLVDYLRKIVFEAEGRPREAKKSIEQARRLFKLVVLGPKKAKRLLLTGKSLLAEGKVAEAQKAFQQALVLDPDNTDRNLAIGEAFLSHGHLKAADEAFQRYLRANPDNVFALNRLGMAMRRQGKIEDAIACYQRALHIDPNEEFLHYNLARAYLDANLFKNAVFALARAMELAPEFDEAKNLMNRLESTGSPSAKGW
ncbi:MAG: tetratricopeptide repeat protein [Pseudomonadota bacterium]